MSISSKSRIIIENVKLFDFVCCLGSIKPEEVNSLEELACRVNRLLRGPSFAPPGFMETMHHLMNNLISHQFPDPLLDSIREIVSNALDAHARVCRGSIPITIRAEKGRFVLIDSGDGMGWRNLFDLFIPGKSSNAKAEEAPLHASSSVSGRFGHGFLSSLRTLYGRDRGYEVSYREEGGISHLSWVMVRDELPVKVEIRADALQEELFLECRTLPLEPLPARKIAICSYREKETPLKVVLTVRKGECLFTLKKVDREVDRLPGTKITIVSSEIENNEKKILSCIERSFLSLSKPLTLNTLPPVSSGQQPVPSLQLESSSSTSSAGNPLSGCEKFSFMGGVLFYRAPSGAFPLKGSLRIFEKERLVVELPLDNRGVFEEVVIDFDHLQLTQVRKEVDFHSLEMTGYIKSLVEEILSLPSISGAMRGALLNSLSPFFDRGGVELRQHLRHQLDAKGYTLYPAELIECGEAGCLYLSLPSLPVTSELPFFRAEKYALYFIPPSEGEPIAAVEKEGEFHLFIDRRLFTPENPAAWRLHLHLLAHWLKNKEYALTVDIYEIMRCGASLPESLSLSAAAPPPLPANFEEYDLVPEGLVPDKEDDYEINYYVEYLPKYLFPQNRELELGCRGWLFRAFKSWNGDYAISVEKSRPLMAEVTEEAIALYQRGITDEVVKNLTNLLVHCAPGRKFFRYLTEAFFCPDRGFPPLHTLACNDPFLKLIANLCCWREDSVKEVHQVLSLLHSAWEGVEVEKRDEFIAAFINFDIPETEKQGDGSHILREFRAAESNYNRWQKLFSLSGCRDGALKVGAIRSSSRSYKWYSNYEEEGSCYFSLAKLIAESSAAPGFVYNVDRLKHTDLLLSWPRTKLVDFFSSLPTTEPSLSSSMERRHCEEIAEIAQIKELSPALCKKWVSLYCCAFQLFNQSTVYLIDMGAFFRLLKCTIHAKNSLSCEELDLIIEKWAQFTCEQFGPLSHLRRLGRLMDRVGAEDEEVQRSLNRASNLWKRHSREELLSLAKSYRELFRDPEGNRSRLSKFYREVWEKEELITAPIRPYLYALLDAEVHTFERCCWPIARDGDLSDYLHRDPDLIEALGSEEIAKRRIAGALRQTAIDYFFIREFYKNSAEAGATKITFDIACDEGGKAIVLVRDNGSGMDEEGLKALKTPNRTTKKRGGDDPNFGWGFFSLFRNFDEVVVVTSRDGKSSHRMALKREGEELLYRSEPIDEPHSRGTTIMLKSREDNPSMEKLKLHAEVVSCCRYITDAEISFCGEPINNLQLPATLRKESYGDLTIHLGVGEEGVYYKEMRIGPFPLETLASLPKKLKEIIRNGNLRIRLFRTHAKQVMNRSHQIEESSFSEKCERLLYALSLNFLFDQWIESTVDSSPFSPLSDDDWSHFNRIEKVPNDRLLAAVEALRYPMERAAGGQSVREKMRERSLELFRSERDGGDVEAAILDFDRELVKALKFDEEEELSFEKLKGRLRDESSFSRLLLHLPLKKGATTFFAIKQRVKEALIAKELLLPSGEYAPLDGEREPFSEIEERVSAAFAEVESSLGVESRSILSMMKIRVLERLRGIKSFATPSGTPLQYPLEEKTLERYLIKVASHFGGSIAVQFYQKNDGRITFVRGNQPIIYVNRSCLPKSMYLHGEKGLEEKGEDEASFSPAWVELIAKITETTLHELTHLQESSVCEATHDSRFRAQLALNLSSLLAMGENKGPLPLLEFFAEARQGAKLSLEG